MATGLDTVEYRSEYLQYRYCCMSYLSDLQPYSIRRAAARAPMHAPTIRLALPRRRRAVMVSGHAPNIHPNVDGEVAYAAPINGLAVGYIQV